MKVSDLLPKLVKNGDGDYKIMISDENNNDIITFNPSGHVAISTEVNNRDVEEIIIVDTQKLIKVRLEAVTNNDPSGGDPDPSNP